MVKIKICGIRSRADALAAAEAGADLLGFNFYPKSARFIDLQTCQGICSMLRQDVPSVQRVGVFVNATIDEIQRAIELCSLDLVQLSGDESAELCTALGSKAFKAIHGIPASNLGAYARPDAPAFLMDAAVTGAYGGTGTQTDWAEAARLACNYPLLLAGGLSPDNVAEAIRQVKPWGVDVASGVESRPGVKDPGRVRAFVEAARSMELERR